MQNAAEELSVWCRMALPQIRDISADSNRRYRHPHLLGHYSRSAKLLLKKTGDLTLAKAAFLHGVPNSNLLDGIIGPGERAITALVAGRRKLRSLNPRDSDVSEQLKNHYLPRLSDLRAAVLLIVEQIDHLDPNDSFGRFSRKFHSCPEKLPEIQTVNNEDPLVGGNINFAESVVIPTINYLGLWAERNLVEDLVFYYRHRQRFETILEFVQQDRVRQEVRDRTNLIRHELRGTPNVDVGWRWHHPASIDRQLRDEADFGKWTHQVSLAGDVVITCTTARDCYAALSALHLSGLFENLREVRDCIGKPTKSGYRAIRTTLVHTARTATITKLQIVPSPLPEERFANLEACSKRRDSRPTDSSPSAIQVYAPDGKPFPLPAGSKVLNFVAEIHSTLVARSSGARVNGRFVPLLHPLEDGDIVHAEIDDTVRALPESWESRVPKSTIAQIRRGYRKGAETDLIDKGRAWLRNELSDLCPEYAQVLDPVALDSYVEEAVQRALRPTRRLKYTCASWWLRRFGKMSVEAESWRNSFQRDDDDKKRLITTLAELINDEKHDERTSLTLPPKVQGRFEELQFCRVCRPVPDTPVVGELTESSLIVHAASAKCSPDGFPLTWQRTCTRSQYFVVEMNNRQGIAAKVLTLVTNQGLDLVDHHGTSIGTGWAVLRFQIRGVGPQGIAKLTSLLSALPDVYRVYGPGHPELPLLEGHLPARGTDNSEVSADDLYYCGPPLRNDLHFYGRYSELRQLRRIHKDATAREPGIGGAVVGIFGPLKVGKTSLVQQFIREIHRLHRMSIVVQSTVQYRQSWRSFSEALRSKIVAEIAKLSSEKNTVTRLGVPTLQAASEYLTQELGRTLVLFIDEAMNVFRCTREEGERTRLIEFMDWAKSAHGIMLILAGPESSVRYCPDELVQFLRTTQKVQLQPFNMSDTKSLLEARNVGTKVISINVPDQLAHQVQGLTNGNPYWCNHIAHKMYQSFARNGRLDYTQDTLQSAVNSVLDQEDVAFRDRIFDKDWDKRFGDVVQMVLAVLAKAVGSEEFRKVCTSKGLLHRIVKRYPDVDAWKLEEVLVDLRLRGTIDSGGLGEKEPTWRLQAPIVGRLVERNPHVLYPAYHVERY
jgi:(p)ppGpp synthase/HD superfamily hydrolase